MVAYELLLVLRSSGRTKLVETIKRCSLKIDGIIRSFNNLGERDLHQPTRKHDETFYSGHYFLITYSAPPKFNKNLIDGMNRDKDVIRSTIVNVPEKFLKVPPNAILDVDCECEENNKFIDDPIDVYRKYNRDEKRRLYKDFGVRL
ncbi:hypothetical protein SNEBB_004407 [Seison nebaliae]|nr:hypothetical protein SNEBB_004407 [Seison nebaliae]